MSTRPISSSASARRPVTAIDFGESTVGKTSVQSPCSARSVEETWFPEHNEASVCLVVGSEAEESADENGVVRKKSSQETLRDMVLTASEYFTKTSVGGNWWE
jgi:hypothetical protein